MRARPPWHGECCLAGAGEGGAAGACHADLTGDRSQAEESVHELDTACYAGMCARG